MSPRPKSKKPSAAAATKKALPKRAPSVAPKAKGRGKASSVASKPAKRSSPGTTLAPAEPTTRKQPKLDTKDARAKAKGAPAKAKDAAAKAEAKKTKGGSSSKSGKSTLKESPSQARAKEPARKARAQDSATRAERGSNKERTKGTQRASAAEGGSPKRRAPARIVDSEAETQLVPDMKLGVSEEATQLHSTHDRGEGGLVPLSDIQEIRDAGASDLDIALAELGDAEDEAAEESVVAPPTTQAHLKSVVESLVFVSDQAITPLQIGRIVKAKQADVRVVLEDIAKDYQGRGIELIEVGGGYQFRSAAASAPFVRDLVAQRPVRLTRAQLETLALIAYRQPITRPEIDDVRGVDSGSAIKVLLERDLVKILGRKDEAGRPLLYGTGPLFLEFFGMKSLQDLPTLREFTELNDENRELFQRKMGEIPDLSDPAFNPTVTPSGTDPEDLEGEGSEARGESDELAKPESKPSEGTAEVPEAELDEGAQVDADESAGEDTERDAHDEADEHDERAGIEGDEDESSDEDDPEPEALEDSSQDDEAANYDEASEDDDEDDEEDEEGSDDDEDGPEEDDSPEDALSEVDPEEEPHASDESEDEDDQGEDDEDEDDDEASEDSDEDDAAEDESEEVSDEDEEDDASEDEDDDEDESEDDDDEDGDESEDDDEDEEDER